MKRVWMLGVLVSAAWAVVGCDEATPTSSDSGLRPLDPRTVEVVLPFEAFADLVEVHGGYGTPSDVFQAALASEYEGVLDSHVLSLYDRFPWRAQVRDSVGTTRLDSAFTFVGGYLMVQLDTTAGNVPSAPVEVGASALPTRFEPVTASWTMIVDTINDQRAWEIPGAGGGIDLGQATWDPATGDSIMIPLDSAQVALLGDTLEIGNGVRFDLRTPGSRINLIDTNLRLHARPNIHRDTLVTVTALGGSRTFIYNPVPAPATGGIRVGGAPSWRTVLTFDLPREITPEGPVCGVLVTCPIAITAERLNSATLELTTAETQSAFQPIDTIYLDARPVLAPDLLPKSPLGSSMVGGLGVPIAPGAFQGDEARTVEIPLTTFLQAILADPETGRGRHLAILTPIEPLSINFASFAGPGSATPPTLRLILTVSDTVEVR